MTVINNGVSAPVIGSEDERARLREALGINSHDIVIGSVGRMDDDSHKRFADLILAFADLPENPSTKLILVGDGRDRSMLEALAAQVEVRDRVIFAGHKYPVGPYYGIMDIFALASEREAFGLVNAEAMRAGLPVVATAVGGIPDIVVHEETGLLVPPRSVQQLQAAISRLITDSAERQAMGSAGKRRADEKFSAERYVQDVRELYETQLVS